jgi:energy-coupling factor transporter ATP-binding protein EcfA2
MTDPFRLVFDVWQNVQEPLSRYLEPGDIAEARARIDERANAAKPRIVVFGTYNAGKSTLINALAGLEGEAAAEVADHPMTDKVSSYEWRGYVLDDTPGINAPIAHEQVTREHLKSADAVVFVLAADGTLEEENSYKELVSLARDGKKILLILNNKKAYLADSPELLGLREKLVENLRHAAAEAEIANIEDIIPIRVVNARSALKGRLERKQALLAASGLRDLEEDLFTLCRTTDRARMARTAGRAIETQIEFALTQMPSDAAVQLLREASDAVTIEHRRLEDSLEGQLGNLAMMFEAKLRNDITSGSSNPGEIARIQAFDSLLATLQREFSTTQTDLLQSGVDIEVEQAISRIWGEPGAFDRDERLTDTASETETAGGFQARDVLSLLKQLKPGYSSAEKEAVVAGLLTAKKLAPDFFKGMGPKAFAGIAEKLGPVIQVGVSLYQTYDAHQAEQKKFEQRKTAELALAQGIKDAATRLRWEMGERCKKLVHAVFGPVEDELAHRMAGLKGEAARREQDRLIFMKSLARLNLLHEEPQVDR